MFPLESSAYCPLLIIDCAAFHHLELGVDRLVVSGESASVGAKVASAQGL